MNVWASLKMFNWRFVRNTPVCINGFYLVWKLLNYIFISWNFSLRYHFDSIPLMKNLYRFEGPLYLWWIFPPIFQTELYLFINLTSSVTTLLQKTMRSTAFLFTLLIEFKYFPFGDVESVRKKVIKICLLSSFFLSHTCVLMRNSH